MENNLETIERSREINIGDVVDVSFNGSQYTLCIDATVLRTPMNEFDFWIFESHGKDKIYKTNERITIYKNL